MKQDILDIVHRERKISLQTLAGALNIATGSNDYKRMSKIVSKLCDEGYFVKQKVGKNTIVCLLLAADEFVELDTPKMAPDNPLRTWAWRKDDGPIANVWNEHLKAKGHQCLWTCKWYSKSGNLSPESMGYRWVDMSREEIFHEIFDVSMRGSKPHLMWLAMTGAHYPDSMDFDMVRAEQLVLEARQKYTTYIAPWDLPDTTGIMKQRPGWTLTRDELMAERAKGRIKMPGVRPVDGAQHMTAREASRALLEQYVEDVQEWAKEIDKELPKTAVSDGPVIGQRYD